MWISEHIRELTKAAFLLLPLFFIAMLSAFGQDREKISLANQYYEQGEIEKALSLYEELIQSTHNISYIHDKYLELLINNQSYKSAEKYLEKQIKSHSNPEKYQIELGQIYEMQGDAKKAANHYNDIINKVASSSYKSNQLAQIFYGKRMYEQALQTYRKARDQQKDEGGIYALQMANLYGIIGQKEQMIEEYFHYINQNPRNLEYVKNMLQNYLRDPEDMEAFERMLYEKVQKHPDNLNYSDLLIWVNIQQKNFYGAFIQARAIQKRLRSGGNELIDIGVIALDNKDYNNAIRIFEYVAKEFKNGTDYFLASRYIIKAREELVKNTYPVNNEEILNLVKDYQKLVKEIGINNTSLEALNSKAMLHAFYLNQQDSAIHILKRIIETPRVTPELKAKSKLSLGEIYLLNGEPWEATLLYSQVEKEHKDQPLGYEAKLKNAKLSYYKGEFGLAQGHLDVLKEATTREIANDAMALSLLIKNNSVLDTSDYVMKQYADADLLLFQNRKEDAMAALDTILINFKGHSLTDEVLFLQAQIAVQLGDYEKSVEKLTLITENWGNDILADDAYFFRARIFEEYLKDREQAREYYQKFLTTFPGSVYVAEARKRFRNLRGDYAN